MISNWIVHKLKEAIEAWLDFFRIFKSKENKNNVHLLWVKANIVSVPAQTKLAGLHYLDWCKWPGDT